MSMRKVIVSAVILVIIITSGHGYAGVEMEPNDIAENATQIFDSQVSAAIDDEIDWFKVQLPATGPVKVTLTGIPADLQVQLGVKDFPHVGWVDGPGNVQYSFDAANAEGLVWVQFNWASSVCGSDWCVVQFTPGGSWHAIKPSASMPATYDGLPVIAEVPTYQLTIEAVPATIVRGPENDTIDIGLGNYTVDGGGGIDTVALPLFPNEYTFTLTGPNQYTAEYHGYTSLFDNVEFVEFGTSSEYKTRLPIAELLSGRVQGQLAKLTDLYLAFFGRAPDVQGLEYWQERHLEKGRNTTVISMDFSWSEEAQALFPLGASNRDFVKTVYQNCFGRDPDQGGWDYWTSKLDALDPQDPHYLNDRGAFVGELLLGAYAETSGPEDRGLLINRHEVALYYVNRLSIQPAEEFDPAINDLLDMVSLDYSTRYNAEHVIDQVFAEPVTLTGVMSNPAMLTSWWTHDPGYDADNDGDGWTEIQGDCNDSLVSISPGAFELCNDGIDQDCNGVDQTCPGATDGDGDGWTVSQGDCNDAVAGIHPGAAEFCGDGIDQNCDGSELTCTGSCIDSPTLADLAGTWDISDDYGVDGYDEFYLIISANGSYTAYDYAGDTYDHFNDCYWTGGSSLTALGNGRFRDNFDSSIITISLCDDNMVITSDGMTQYPRTTKSNFTPICQPN